ncbi:MAG TPA: alpha/beta hydrolase [Clostridiaceae bacterium]
MINEKINLWNKNGDDGFIPTLVTYVLDGSKNRGAILICPGGGYEMTSDREAEQVALQFNASGFHAFVVYYSCAPRKHPQPLMDVSKAMCIIRDNAEIWKVDKDKIAICGFSAGGHLAANLGVHWDKPYLAEKLHIKAGYNKPNALLLCYPVISSGEFGHMGSFVNLLGADADKNLLYEMSLEHQISKSTPPTFLWHTFEDDCVPVENTLLFAQGLRKNNIPFELHIYPEGGHGLSLATIETDSPNAHVATWMGLAIEWLKILFK